MGDIVVEIQNFYAFVVSVDPVRVIEESFRDATCWYPDDGSRPLSEYYIGVAHFDKDYLAFTRQRRGTRRLLCVEDEREFVATREFVLGGFGRTLPEQLALAVLRGDEVAQMALKDYIDDHH